MKRMCGGGGGGGDGGDGGGACAAAAIVPMVNERISRPNMFEGGGVRGRDWRWRVKFGGDKSKTSRSIQAIFYDFYSLLYWYKLFPGFIFRIL